MDLVSVKVVNQVRSHAEGQLKNQVSSQAWGPVRQQIRNYEEFRY